MQPLRLTAPVHRAAACIQLDAAIPNFLAQEHTTLGEGCTSRSLSRSEAGIDLPTKPGLGIELDEEALADKIGHDWVNPQTYDAFDGSVVDW